MSDVVTASTRPASQVLFNGRAANSTTEGRYGHHRSIHLHSASRSVRIRSR